MVKKKRKIQMPSSIRKKMMAATSMLLVSAILMVTTSYAWFTLSTAPEVTGITTSVGANGNLEMALLTTETFANTELITSNTGDSMDVAGKTKANITWGNLVDLSDESYGLQKIALYPSALNATEKNEVNTLGTGPLSVPKYGADGRVSELVSNTVSSILVDNKFSASDTQEYGVRAVGTAAGVSQRSLVFKSGKSGMTSALGSAKNPMKNAIANQSMILGMLAVTGIPTTYSDAQIEAMKEIAKGTQSTLNSIVSAYGNAILASVAADESVEEAAVIALQTAIAGKTDAGDLLTALGDYAKTEVNASLATLDTTQTTVASALAYFDSDGFTNSGITDHVIDPLLGGLNSANILIYDANGEKVENPSTENVSDIASISLAGGVVKTVADYLGVFELTVALDTFPVYAGDVAKKADIVGEMNTVATAVNKLTPPSSTSTDTTITDYYGYILDFAFRTNAADAVLQLQTTPVNRVYDDATGNAMQGAGSTVTFTYDTSVNSAQAAKLLEAIRIVFFNPDPSSNEIYATAKLTNINTGTTSATADILVIDSATTKTVIDYDYVITLGQDAYTKSQEATDGKYTYTRKSSIVIDGIEHDLTGIGEATLTMTENEFASKITETKTTASYDITLGQDAYTKSQEATDGKYTYTRASSINIYGTTYNISGVGDETLIMTEAEFANLPAKTTVAGTESISYGLQATDKGVIAALEQSVVKKISTLVYMDGTNIDNAAVGNGTNSGSLKLNLQFNCGGANGEPLVLNPMDNSTLKSMDKTTTE